MAASASTKKCTFCSNDGKYTCPRCNSQYCSPTCYKNERHVQCSENFYKEQVKAELESGSVSAESKKKMIEILKRVESGGDPSLGGEEETLDSDDDEDEVDLAQRMEGINLNDSEAVWKLLSESEREEFRHMINSGNYEDLMPAWSPWWEQNVPLVEEVTEGKNATPSYIANCPPVIDVPLLSEVMKAKPSSCIPFNILNVLASYVWMVRLFNGDHQESSLDATEAVLSLSTVLAANANFEEAVVAVESPKMEAQNHPWLMESEEFAATVKNDVRKILQGPIASDNTFYIRSALSEIHAVLSTSKTSLSKKRRSSQNRSTRERKGLFVSTFAEANQHVELKIASLQTVKASIKKVEFLLSYVKEYSSIFMSLVPT